MQGMRGFGVDSQRELLEFLKAQASKRYKDFQTKITPNNREILGVNIPCLRSIAKELKKQGQDKAFLEFYLKENNEILCAEIEMLLSIVLSERAREVSNKEKFCEFLNLAKLLSGNLRSWASCDIFTPKIRQEFCEEYFNFLLELSANKGEFISRLGIVGMLAFIPQKSSKILEHLQKIDSEFYYVNMAIAWVFSIIFIKENARNLTDSIIYVALKNHVLKPFIHNTTISKIRDSYRVNKDTKDMLKTLRVKK